MKARLLKKRNSSIKYFTYGHQRKNLYRMKNYNLQTMQFLNSAQYGWVKAGASLYDLVPITEEQAKSNFPKAF